MLFRSLEDCLRTWERVASVGEAGNLGLTVDKESLASLLTSPRGEDRVLGDVLLHLSEYLLLDPDLLEDGFDDPVAVGEVGLVGGPGDEALQLARLVGVDAPLGWPMPFVAFSSATGIGADILASFIRL